MGLGRQYFLHCSRSMGDILDIVDSIWFYPIMFFVGLAILFLFDIQANRRVVINQFIEFMKRALEPGSLLLLVCAPPLVGRVVPGQVRDDSSVSDTGLGHFIGLEVKQVSEHINEYGPVSQGPEKKIKNDNKVSSPRSGLFLLGFKRVGPPNIFFQGGPAQYILTAIPNHLPSLTGFMG